MSSNHLARSTEYQALLIKDFRDKVYPLAIACVVIFSVFFLVNASGIGNPKFMIPDAVAAVLFAGLAHAVKKGTVLPHFGSIFILAVITTFYTTVIIFSGSVHGILFFYCTIPFFAFYMAGSKVGLIQGICMIIILLSLWGGSKLGWLHISYSDLEMGVLSFLLSFSIISAWGFERVRERTFRESYQSGLRHETLMQALDEVYYRVGMDGIIQEIGEAIHTITGYTPQEAEGTQISTFYADPNTREGYVNALKKTGSVKNYPIELIGKQGNLVMISMSSRMFFDESGQPIYIEGLIRDITKERKLENERKEHLELLSNLSIIETALADQDFELSIQHSLEKMIEIFDADHVFLAPISYTLKGEDEKRCFETCFLASRTESIQLDSELFSRESEIKAYMTSASKQTIPPFVVDSFDDLSPELVDKYKLKAHMMILIQVTPTQQWLLGVQNCQEAQIYSSQQKRLFVDISHRLRGALGQLILQKDLQATVERVEIASKAKSEFLATMSHELRTPLHGVIGLLDLLGIDASQLSLEQQRNLSLARTSAHVLSSLIDDVLDLAKVESGKVELQKQSFVLKDALYDALVPFVMKAREKGINLNLEMKNVAAVIEGDVVRLRQVLLNLVGNAIKFTSEGYVRIVITQDEHTLQINIEDSGIGIDRDKQDDVFKPFSQVHDINILGDNLQEKGTGLGTTISQHFVHMMGGVLTLQSEPEVGSTLSIRLPLHQVGTERITVKLQMEDFSKLPEELEAGIGQGGNKELKHWKVLLAEDDPIGRRVAEKRLSRVGFQVDSAADGLTAWEKIKENDYDLLLTDVRMPGLDGMQLTKTIRKYEKEQGKDAMLILGLSAYALEEVKQKALDSGMDEFVTKPVDMDKLMNMLEQRYDSSEAIKQ